MCTVVHVSGLTSSTLHKTKLYKSVGEFGTDLWTRHQWSTVPCCTVEFCGAQKRVLDYSGVQSCRVHKTVLECTSVNYQSSQDLR